MLPYNFEIIMKAQQREMIKQAEQRRLLNAARPSTENERRMFSSLPAAWLTILTMILLLTACNTASAGTETTPANQAAETIPLSSYPAQTTDLAIQYPEIVITANEYTYGLPAQVEAGLVSVTLKNEGQEPHHIQLARLNDGVTIEQFQTALAEGPAAFGLVTWAGGPAVVDPTGSQTVTVDLTPGIYLLLCFVPDHEGTPHLALGQLATMEVVERAEDQAILSPPQAASLVKMLDFAYLLPTGIQTGPQVWEIANEGQQPHEINLVKLAEGKTMADLQAFMDAPHGAPPFSNVGGLQGIDPGESGWLHLNLTPGDYVAICHIPDPASGQSHEELGMIIPFSVE